MLAKSAHVPRLRDGFLGLFSITRRTWISRSGATRPKTYGVSETRILALLRNAYSQNYLYLIKKPEDQYQVILEVEDPAAQSLRTCRCSTSSRTTARIWFRCSALVKWKTTLGPQAVNHLNQFTSVTIFFNLKPGVAIGDATDFISKAAAEVVPPSVRGGLQGEALTFPTRCAT